MHAKGNITCKSTVEKLRIWGSPAWESCWNLQCSVQGFISVGYKMYRFDLHSLNKMYRFDSHRLDWCWLFRPLYLGLELTKWPTDHFIKCANIPFFIPTHFLPKSQGFWLQWPLLLDVFQNVWSMTYNALCEGYLKGKFNQLPIVGSNM